jgi:pectate lyase
MIYNRKRNRWYSAGIFLLFGFLLSHLFFQAVLFAEPIKAFPNAMGWAAYTPGGRGGKIIRVTNLKTAGPGSFAAAVQMKGRRIIVFEVGGVIDLKKNSLTITEPFLTIAGQTAPSPGITLIRGGINIEAHDVIVRHIRVRPGEAGAKKKSGWEVDGIATGSYNIIVDHCSCTWATDENLSASGPRFDGQTVEQWRKNTSHRITFSNCIIAEGLRHSTHGKGEHSKGSLIHDNITEIAIIGNLYANNMRRNPYFKGGVRGIMVNNYIVNPGRRAIHYCLSAGEWKGHEYVTGQIAIVGNVMEHGRNTPPDMPLFVLRGSGPIDVFARDNVTLRQAGQDVRIIGTNDEKSRRVDAPPLWPDAINVVPVADVKNYVLKNAGARPWDRDAIDKRIIREVREGAGKIIDSEQEVGGYPAMKETRAPFDPNEWNLATMEKKENRF